MSTPAEKRLYQLTLAIQKAINSVETPVKEKHVRSTIIGTFQEQSAATYWMVALRLPMQENRIVAWKFCHVTHKLLREGHPACLDDSQRHVPMIENLGKLWVHLREGYGKLVHLYCNLLVCKLKFHRRNPRFPGNMQLTAEELDAAAENDVNNYFQLCVELFDYMDELLNLQAAVFDSLGNARANSMTASGQCRLAALIPCAQDASQLYDCNVRILFRLHASLPADTLAGHRDRFRQQFKKLSSFYKHASSLQYYRNLLSLPVLPSNPPNFLQQSDFGTYVTPVVSIPEQPPDRDEMDTVGSLIDTSDTISQVTTPDSFEAMDTRTTPSPQPDPLVERDRLIDHLQNELKRMRSEISQMVQERNTMITSMKSHCARLETQLHSAKTELEEEKQKAEVLSAETPEIKQKLTETEEKSKILDEKFQKLKGAYTQLREEHITLIRQKAEVDKTATNLRSLAAQHESAKTALQQQLNDKMKDVEILQQSASSSEEIEAYKQEIANLRSDIEQARQKDIELETIKASMETLQIEHKTSSTEQEEKIQTITNELKEALENLEKNKLEKEESEKELNRVKLELTGIKTKSGDEFRKVLEEKEQALKEIAEITLRHQQEKEILQTRLQHTEGQRVNTECELQDLLQHNTVLEADVAALKRKLEDSQNTIVLQTSKLVAVASETSLSMTEVAISALDRASAVDSSKVSAECAARALDRLEQCQQVKGNEESIARAALHAAHNSTIVSAYIADVANSSTDMELSDKLTSQCRGFLTTMKGYLESLKSGTPAHENCKNARELLSVAVDEAARGDMKIKASWTVDDELSEMDKAIAQAAEQIESIHAASRAADSGIQLEVNSKILDACTALMAAVRVLVQHARTLQNEIGDPKTRQKLYRRNPQWSEGLISAAKAVVFAAKLLVTSADEAVSGSGSIEGVARGGRRRGRAAGPRAHRAAARSARHVEPDANGDAST